MTSQLRCAAALVAVFSFSLPVQVQSSIPRVFRSAGHAECGAVPDAGRRGWERCQCADTGRTGCGLDALVRRTIVGGVAAERAGRMVRRGRG